MVERGDMYAWNKRPRWWTNIGRRSALVVVVIMLTLPSCMGSDRDYKTIWAHVNYTYRDPDTNKLVNESDRGEFGTKSLEEHREGIVMHVHDKENTSKGCTEYTNKIPQVPWIALIERGGCEFSQKIKMATQTYNASAVVVYNFKEATNKDLITMNLTKHNVKAQVSIFMSRETGKKLAKLADSGVLVEMTIRPGEKKSSTANDTNSISKTSVLFVSISFIVLMIISLAWLIFYYIQRFRYAHAKERLARRLTSAAKKAISKIPQKMVKNGDRELDSEFDQCAVCIEGYKPHDVIRILPCKLSHVRNSFRLSSPWSHSNRTSSVYLLQCCALIVQGERPGVPSLAHPCTSWRWLVPGVYPSLFPVSVNTTFHRT